MRLAVEQPRQRARADAVRRRLLLRDRRELLRPRTLIYLLVWSGIGVGLLFALGARSHIDISVAQDRNPPFMLMSDGSVRNAFTLKVRNMESRPRAMELTLAGVPGAVMWNDEESRRSAASQALTSGSQKLRSGPFSALATNLSACAVRPFFSASAITSSFESIDAAFPDFAISPSARSMSPARIASEIARSPSPLSFEVAASRA